MTGYYRKFIKVYALIAHPLIELLKKNQFGWNEDARRAFDELMCHMTNSPVLTLPNFQKILTVET